MIGWFRPRLLITVLITCGVAAWPANWRATVFTGRAKNRKNAPVATSQMTTMPVRMRRMRKPVIAMSAASRRGYLGCHVGYLRLAVVGEHLTLAAASAGPPGRESPLSARVHGIPDPVAEQVERERGDEQCRRGEYDVPPGRRVEVLRVGQD